MADRLEAIDGVTLKTDRFFNEFTVSLGQPAAEIADALAERNIFAGVPVSRLFPDADDLADHLIVAVTEMVTEDDIEALCSGLAEVLGKGAQ